MPLPTLAYPLKIAAVLACMAVVSACSDHHDTVHAVDVVPLAEQNAQAAAPVAEPITFDDEHLPKMGDANASTAEQTPSADTATTDEATPTDTVATDDSASTAEQTETNTPNPTSP